MKRRFLAPEVVQSSAMDCGPAALKSILEGFGVPASYGRLREACQTDVDGTSIDTLEQIALQLGLEAEQIMVPVEHLLLPNTDALPAIVVVQLPNGLTHFVVAWRRHGPLIQLMDPSSGRRWITPRRFKQEIYIHSAGVPAEGWREWAGSDSFLTPLRNRIANLGAPPAAIGQLIDAATSDTSWRSLAALDAAVRIVDSVVDAGGLRRGNEAAAVLKRFFEDPESIPPNYWSVQPSPAGDEELRFRGAVLLRVTAARESSETSGALPPDLLAALHEAPAQPGRELVRLLRADGILSPAALILSMFAAAGAVLIEALLFRGVFGLGPELDTAARRVVAVVALAVFSGALLLLDFPLATGLLRLGRVLEIRLRLAFLAKIPKLGDRYFQSRLTSDMAERSHSIHQVRHLSELGGQLTRAFFELLLTAAAIAWIDPSSAPWALASAAFAVLLPLLAQPPLMERDLRVRSHLGALSRFYLDALLGLVAVRAHRAERAVRREHESLVLEWARAALGLQRVAVAVDALQFLCGFGLAAALLFSYLGRSGNPSGVLLLVYWALNLPVLGQEIALVAWQYPTYRNLTLRLFEPLGAPEENAAPSDPSPSQPRDRAPAAIALEHVTVHAAGHTILEDINVIIPPRSHVAIVGPSGAGKSSLVGLLLGWHRAAAGRVLVDGKELDGALLETLRSQIAWVDPAVQLWNRPLLENLTYGANQRTAVAATDVIDQAGLRDILEKLPNGFETPLGEGGALVSGGEGQRVRLGRAFLRPDVRLVILDEPFRGLAREQRRELLARARNFWNAATLICITHDVSETLNFPRVLVIEGGKVVEDGDPADLAANPASHYASMLGSDRMVRETLWSDSSLRPVQLQHGQVKT